MVPVVDQSPVVFGIELRRRRCEAGLSLGEFAQRVHYSKSHLSKIETGAKRAGIDLARRCDAQLGANGELAALVEVAPALRGAGETEAAGASQADTDVPEEPHLWWADEGDQVGTFRLLFRDLRNLGQSLGSRQMVPLMHAHVDTLEQLARRSSGSVRKELLTLAARFAEFTGWMYQECGDDAAAQRLTERAVPLAVAGGDLDMVGFAPVRKAEIALYRHDAVAAVELAQSAQATSTNARIRALAAHTEAQGHAIAGDEVQWRRALDRAQSFMDQHIADSTSQPVYGSSNIIDLGALARGWCLQEAGRSAEAAAILAAEFARVPPKAERARARVGIRLALAYATMRELELAVAVAEPILHTLPRIDSATIRFDLKQLARTLHRWPAEPVVRRIMPALALALHPAYTGRRAG